MGKKLFLGSVGTAEAFRRDPVTKKLDLMFVSKTLTDSSINISIAKDDLRAGTGAPIVASFYHDPAVEITLTDVMFKKEYVEAQLGTKFEAAGGSYQSEKVDAAEGGFTLKNKPLSLNLGCGINSTNIWYTKEGEDDWKSFEGTVTGKVASGDSNIKLGDKLCVRYYGADDQALAAEVTSDIIPEELYLIITAPLFAGDACSASNGKKAGTIQYEVPRFRLNGGQDFAMAMSSNQTINLAGSALAFEDGCNEGASKLLRIIQIVNDSDAWYKDVNDLVVDPDSVGNGKTLDVYAVDVNGNVVKANNGNLTFEFAKGDEAQNEITTEGKLTIKEADTLTVKITGKPKVTQTVAITA